MDLDGIAVFVKVVQAGSFSGAARQLGVPNTTVSAKVARLEKRLGVTLIQRTTRKLHVTPAGHAYFERCVHALEEIETAEAEMTLAAPEPAGMLRITAPADVAHGMLPPIVDRFLGLYPRTRVELIITNRVVDLIGEGVHLALRGAPLADSATLVARPFMQSSGGLWASAAYLQRHPAPKTPADLAEHQCLLFPRLAGQPLRLSDGREKIELAFQARLAVDDLETLRSFALLGRGIATLVDYLAEPAGLVRVLPKWTWTAGMLSFVYPRQPFLPANVRAFIDTALAEHGGGEASASRPGG